ncbi:hypothetical protein VTJ04DRAFT_1803 [Mycothermus thermophilus]|uniref:uncharacterized protein n=1 Tax=Humicola insolens TaxID=85995 RepID=UPI0037448651
MSRAKTRMETGFDEGNLGDWTDKGGIGGRTLLVGNKEAVSLIPLPHKHTTQCRPRCDNSPSHQGSPVFSCFSDTRYPFS